MFLLLFLNIRNNTINSLTHNYYTWFMKDINITSPKLKTVFGQPGPYILY